jgi:ribosomal protein S12 methylthiotransferase accessory factor
VSVELLPPSLRRAVSPYTGIVASLDESLHATSEPPLFRFSCDVGRGGTLLDVPLAHLAGVGGSGRDRASAAAAAVGEALERYAATFVPHDRLIVATADDLAGEAVAPERFALFSPEQYATPRFPFEPFTRETPVAWVRGISLLGGQPAWLPAELVYLADAVPDGAARIGYATSSGMACAADVDDAVVRGLCELLERDAFMIVWAGRLSLPLLDWSADARIAALDRALFVRTGLRYAVIDLSALHRLPTFLGVVRAPRDVPGALGVGAGTAQRVEQAWCKALSEAFAARSAGAKLALLDGDGFANGPAAVRSFEDHIRYYADAGRASAADFLDASVARVAVEHVPKLEGQSSRDVIKALCARVGEAGASAYAVDVTSPDVRDLGLRVTKVVAPELCALDVVHAARFLGGRRLYEAAANLGLRATRLTSADVNPEPHPFP